VFKKEEERQPDCSREQHYSDKNWPSTSNEGRYEIPGRRSGETPDALAPDELTGPKSLRNAHSLPQPHRHRMLAGPCRRSISYRPAVFSRLFGNEALLNELGRVIT
jgi:hypothetical protein